MQRLLIVCWLSFLLPAAGAELKIVASYPDLGALARVIGGSHVRVTSLARGTEDPHYVDPKPSFIRVLNRADLLIQSGMDLEAGWLQPLVRNARNPKILPAARGSVDASAGIIALGISDRPVDRSEGDVHPLGNPHYLLDPENAKIVAATIAKSLAEHDSAHAAEFESNLSQFQDRLDRKIEEWNKLLGPYRGAKVVCYHTSFDYLLDQFGFVLAGTIEPKPGIEPSPAHLTRLIEELKGSSVQVVLAEPNRSRRTGEYVAKALDAPLVILPLMVEGHESAFDYISLMDYNVNQILAHLKKPS